MRLSGFEPAQRPLTSEFVTSSGLVALLDRDRRERRALGAAAEAARATRLIAVVGAGTGTVGVFQVGEGSAASVDNSGSAASPVGANIGIDGTDR